MGVDDSYRLRFPRSLPSAAVEPHQRGTSGAAHRVTTRAVFKALMATTGASEVLDEVPALAPVESWESTAHFSVCAKSGTARALDLWDVDHFDDGVSDIEHSLSLCRAWFSSDEGAYFGSAQTKTGRVNCHFGAPRDGTYV